MPSNLNNLYQVGSTKRGTSTSVDGWKRQNATLVPFDGTIKVFGTNACIVRVYSLTCASAHVWHSWANGGGKLSKTISTNLRKAKT
jgi:hypothetical protein